MERQSLEKNTEKSKVLEDIEKFFGRAGDIVTGFICGAVFCYPFAKPAYFEIKGQYRDHSVSQVYNAMTVLTKSPGVVFIEEPNYPGRYIRLNRYLNSINQEIGRRNLEK